jgi:hypothetical protein
MGFRKTKYPTNSKPTKAKLDITPRRNPLVPHPRARGFANLFEAAIFSIDFTAK